MASRAGIVLTLPPKKAAEFVELTFEAEAVAVARGGAAAKVEHVLVYGEVEEGMPLPGGGDLVAEAGRAVFLEGGQGQIRGAPDEGASGMNVWMCRGFAGTLHPVAPAIDVQEVAYHVRAVRLRLAFQFF